MERVLIFGGAGYIGCPTTELLLKKGYHVTVFDCLTYGDFGIRHLLNNPNLEVVSESICDITAVNAAVKKADAIILLSAIVGHRSKEVPIGTMRTVNLLASTVVLDAAIEHGVPRFIFGSTHAVYGNESGLYFETSMPSPVSLYARLKLRMEERVINAKKKGEFHPTALRIGTCHGVSGRMRFDLVINGLMRDAITKGEINLISGEQMRAFVHVRDVANAIYLTLSAHENLISGEVFNVGAHDQNLQINQVVNVLKQICPDVTINRIQGEPDLIGYRLSSKKIEKVLDFKDEVSIEQSMAEIKQAFEENLFPDCYSLRYNNV